MSTSSVNDNSGSNPWDEFVRSAQEYSDTGRLASEEIDYKLAIGRKLAATREAVLSDQPGAESWSDRLKDALTIKNNLIFFRERQPFTDWVNEHPDDALAALRLLWAPDAPSLHDRITAFNSRVPRLFRRGEPQRRLAQWVRSKIISILLMGLDVEQYPPFRSTTFDDAYKRTGYPKLGSEADEAALYEHALGFLDRFVEEASERGLSVRNLLEAQSLVWAVLNASKQPAEEEDEPSSLDDPASDLDALADATPDLRALGEELLLGVDFLENIAVLLEEKRQVIFQGPPGTGKTYVALKLAACLAGSMERVTLVQFHPSYAYEDFVQGFRPALVNGQPGFELMDGPLLRAAARAEAEPDAKHFLVIDEINRGNLAKVFGELYFLLEYRDHEINLQYGDNKFRLPRNLYIIGTMNTADRSIALVDLALRRRFYFVEFHPDEPPVKGLLRRWLARHAPDMARVADLVDRANEQLNDRNAAIGPSYFMNPKRRLDDAAVGRIWEHSILPYIEEHLFGEHERLGEFALDSLRRAGAPGSANEDGGGQDEAADNNDASA